MNPGVPQIMLGLLCIVAGILVVKALGSELGWLLFVLGSAIGCAGGFALAERRQRRSLSN